LAGRREPALELQTLRAEMNALQQTNRQFGRDLDDLRSRLDAVSAAAKPRKSR